MCEICTSMTGDQRAAMAAEVERAHKRADEFLDHVVRKAIEVGKEGLINNSKVVTQNIGELLITPTRYADNAPNVYGDPAWLIDMCLSFAIAIKRLAIVECERHDEEVV